MHSCRFCVTVNYTVSLLFRNEYGPQNLTTSTIAMENETELNHISPLCFVKIVPLYPLEARVIKNNCHPSTPDQVDIVTIIEIKGAKCTW